MRAIKTLGAVAAAVLAGGVALAAPAANASVLYSFANSLVAFSSYFSSPVTTSATVAPTVLFGSTNGDVTYAATATADTVTFNNHTYSFSPLAFTTEGTYNSGSSQFSTLVFQTTPAAPEASDYAFLIAGLGAVGGYMAYRKRRTVSGPSSVPA